MPGTNWELFKLQLRRIAPLTDADFAMLEPSVEESTLPKGGSFALEGRRDHNIGFLLEGNMRQYYTRDGEEKTTYFFFENHLLAAYVSCLTNTPSLLTIEALTPCRLLQFPYAALRQLYDRSHAWERFGRLLAEYVSLGLEERMVGLLTLSPEERYEALLQSGKDKIIARIPQHLIANYLGVNPVSLSRIRQRISRRRPQ